MKRWFTDSNIRLLAVLMLISLLIFSASHQFTVTDEIDWTDVFFDGFIIVQMIFWLFILSLIFDASPEYRLVRIGIALNFIAYVTDLMDEFYDIEGMLSSIEPMGQTVGTLLISIGMFSYYIRSRQKIDEILVQNETFYKESIIDSLTKLYNRQYFHKAYQIYMENTKNPSSVLVLIDVDDFKRINDSLGHYQGDQTLITVANAIKDSVNLGTAIRYGGDEFLVFYEKGSLSTVESDMENLMTRLKTFNQTHNVSLSIGITKQRVGEDYTSYFQRVDSAMYKAKDLGKNQIYID